VCVCVCVCVRACVRVCVCADSQGQDLVSLDFSFVLHTLH